MKSTSFNLRRLNDHTNMEFEPSGLVACIQPGGLTTDFLENWIIYDLDKKTKASLIYNLQSLKKIEREQLKDYVQLFEKIAMVLCPNNYSFRSLELLKQVLNNDEYLNSYIPVADNELQIMTIHKSKGLEFDIVIHLDLYGYILPSYDAYNNPAKWNEDLNLHYVALTRAKKACFLLSSSKRYNYNDEIKDGIQSEFLGINNLIHYRQNI